MADSTLAAIITKVRRLTRSPSNTQITDAQIEEYINTFVLYDFPEHLRLFTLRENFTFFCDPYIDVYKTNTVNPLDELYNFKNKYITVHEPVYIAGNKAFLSQSPNEFFGIYPKTNAIAAIATGNGVATNYVGVLESKPVIIGSVTFTSVDIADAGLVLKDDGLGNLTGDGNGGIDYITGAYVLNFAVAPGNGVVINSQTIPYTPAKPETILYHDNEFTLRPVPDKPYRIEMEVYVRPTEILAGNSPELEQWWQYIAYGAAKKV